ncbi:MAG: hypothetical protein QXN53_08150 [Thermoproteota archaeon]
MEYNVIIYSIFPMGTAPPESLDDLKKLMRITGRLFGFELLSKKEKKAGGSPDIVSSS